MSEHIVNKFLRQKTELHNQKYRLLKQIETLEDGIKELDKLIFNQCEHEWVRDEFALFDDTCKKICKKCKLYPIAVLYEY